MFCLVAFVLATVAQEFWRGASARRIVTGEPWPRALVKLAGRNRRRYGGYLVHAGIAVLFLGVAASSAFHHQSDVRVAVGQSWHTGGYTLTYRKPTASLGGDRGGTGAPISLGAVIDVRKGKQRFTLRPSRNFYPTQDPTAGVIGRYFNGDANSAVDVRWGLKRDFWLAIRPDIGSLQKPIAVADKRFPTASSNVQAILIAALTDRYRKSPPPAAFRSIDSPLVVWIWIGGALAVLGALIAVWPAPEARLRRVRSLYAARLGRELSRA
jgi:cytochrome c-type biogenesis protein CcmF